jgi:Ni/Fe-hydrogenase subunit HybB-like protein
MVAIGIVMNRFDASWFGILPIDGLRYSPSWMEVAILAGVFSGVLLVYTIIAHYFPVFSETTCDEDCETHRSYRRRLDQLKTTVGD